MQATTKKHLPRILCLHGRGSSAAIYDCQARMILKELENEFEFVFINGPYPAEEGLGLAPVYSDSGPFYAWDSNGKDTAGEKAKVRNLLWDTLTEGAKDPNSQPFIGLMGFSQGGKTITGFLLYLADMQKKGVEDAPDIKFAIINNASAPPVYVDEGHSEDGRKVILPTVHLLGTKDPIASGSRKLASAYYETGAARLTWHTAGHQCPVKGPDVDRCMFGIRELLAVTMPKPE